MIEGEYSLALSLGVDCRVRYQLSRHRYSRAHPGKMAAPKELYSTAKEGTFFFDWLVSPAGSVAEVLRNRFEGVFERENLSINKKGSVVDDRYRLVFQHAFPRVNDVVTEEIVATEYEQQRAKTRYLADKTLEAMQCGGLLYVIAGATPEQLAALADVITEIGGPDFHIVNVRAADERRGFIDRGEKVSTYVIDKKIDKPDGARWEGDDREWGSLLEQLPVRW
jgi:hypothetical protein